MANELDNTALAAIVPANWRPRFVERYYDSKKVTPRILNVTGDYADHNGKGDIAHISVEGFDLTVNNTGADGSLTVQSQTLTDVSLSVNQRKDVTMEIVGKTRKQAFDVWETQFPISAGNAVRRQIEKDALALYSDATLTASGDGTGNLGEDELLAAIQQHISAQLPIMDNPGDFTFALAENQFAPIKKQGFIDYNRTGNAGDGGAAEIELPELWSVPVVFSTQVASVGGIRYSLLFHKTAMAWAAQQNVEPKFADRLAAAKDSYLMTVLALYGVKTVVGGRMGQIKSKA